MNWPSKPQFLKCLNTQIIKGSPSSFPSPRLMNPNQAQINRLYQQNQRLGYSINYLTDQNNFYRITINNIKKLNNNINKHLLTANNKITNSKNTQTVVDPRTVGDSYIAITNKIHLKNLQMKVGTMKRKVDKFEKTHTGSLTSLVKQSQILEKEINVLSRQFQYLTIQDKLLDNLYLDDYLMAKLNAEEFSVKKHSSCKNLPGAGKNRFARDRNSCSERIEQLDKQNIRYSNKLEQILKEGKELKEEKGALIIKLKKIRDEREKLASKVYHKGFNIRVVQASEMERLRNLSKRQTHLQEEIAKQDLLLEEQYKTNQEYKQKILDRNELQVKDIKGLQEKIKKRTEEVKEIKSKCENLEGGKSKPFIKHK